MMSGACDENNISLLKVQNHKTAMAFSQRAVLQDIDLNTLQEPVQPKKSGGGSPTASSTPTVPVKPDHEAHVQFAREFVVELVETVPKKSSEKAAALAKVADKEDIVSLKSVSPSEASFQSVNSVTENTSLPDLLQPESVYKKQTDTDTDTTEYESAAETDPLDAASPIENLIAEDIVTSFNEALDKKDSPSEPQKPSENSVSQASEPSPLSEAYEDVGENVAKPESDDQVKSLDISGLCLFVSNLCLDSPKRSEDSESPEGQKVSLNKSSDIVINSAVTDQSFASVGDSTFIVGDNCAKSLDNSSSAHDQTEVASSVDSILSSNLPVASETTFVKQEQNTPEVTVVKSLKVVPVDSPVIKQAEVSSQNTPGVSSPQLPQVLPETTPIVTSENLPEALCLNSSEIKLVETSDETSIEIKSNDSEVSTAKLAEETPQNICNLTSKIPSEVVVKSTKESLETVEVAPVKVTEESKTEEVTSGKLVEVTSDVNEISPESSSEETLEALTKTTEVTLVEPEVISEKDTSEVLQLVDSLIRQTELPSEETPEELPIKSQTPVKTATTSSEVILKVLEQSSVKSDEILDKADVPESIVSNKAPEEKSEVSEVTLTEAKLKASEEHLLKNTEAFPKEVSTAKLPEVEQIQELVQASEGTVVKPAETNVLKTTLREEHAVVEQTPKSQETEGEAKTFQPVDGVHEWISETDVCSSDSIPIEETASVASVTNSIEDKLLESKDFSTSFEVPSDLAEEKVQAETVDSPVNLNRVDLGASGDTNLQEVEKQVEVEKKQQSVLNELFELCDRQQKDLELGDEKFVDGREFFDAPSISANLNQTVVVSNSQPELPKTVTGENYDDFDESIAEEAEKIFKEILNASAINEWSVNSIENTTHQMSKMADVRGGSNNSNDGVNPFATQSSLRRSPPPSAKSSPRPSSRGASPADSPRTKSRISAVNQGRDNSLSRDGAGDGSPRSMSGKNSPDCRISSNRVSSLEGSPKNSISSEINQSEAGPEIADEAHVQSGDVFKDPSAFDFLNSVGNSNTPTDLRKESLYIKFDPLVGGARTVDQTVPLPPSYEAKSNNIGPSANNSPHDSFSNNVASPRNVAISVVDKLISLSPSPRRHQMETPVKQIITPVSTPVKEEPQHYPDNSSMVEELYLLREILAKQDEKHREDILMLQQKIDQLQAQLKEYEDREAKLNKKVAEKAQGQKQMSIIMEEYEKTISRLVAEKEQERQAHEIDRSSLLKERDTAMGHLANIEIAFSDLHKKYERSKTVIEGFKKNEEVLRASLSEYEGTIRKQEQKYDVLKSHAMAQLENANQELDSVKRSQQAEAAKLKAMLKKAEIKTSSLEEMLEQKVKENQELASICDELINKVGNSE